MRDTGWMNNGNCLWERYVEDDHGDRILGVTCTIPRLDGGRSYVQGYTTAHGWEHVGDPGGTTVDDARSTAIVFLLGRLPVGFQKPADLAPVDVREELGKQIAHMFGDDPMTALEELPGIVAESIGAGVTHEDMRAVYRAWCVERSMMRARGEQPGSVAP